MRNKKEPPFAAAQAIEQGGVHERGRTALSGTIAPD